MAGPTNIILTKQYKEELQNGFELSIELDCGTDIAYIHVVDPISLDYYLLDWFSYNQNAPIYTDDWCILGSIETTY